MINQFWSPIEHKYNNSTKWPISKLLGQETRQSVTKQQPSSSRPWLVQEGSSDLEAIRARNQTSCQKQQPHSSRLLRFQSYSGKTRTSCHKTVPSSSQSYLRTSNQSTRQNPHLRVHAPSTPHIKRGLGGKRFCSCCSLLFSSKG